MGRAVELLIEAAGIEKLRITGGEPLLSPKFDALLPVVMALPLADVSITTNGQLLPRKAGLIIDAGCAPHQHQPRHLGRQRLSGHRPQAATSPPC